MKYAVLLTFLLATASPVAAAPTLTLAAYQVTPGTQIVVRAAGFTPGGIVISHLTRPDGSEYPTMTFEADRGGAFTHTITIVPTMIGTYELRMTDRESRGEASTRFMMAAVGSAPLPAGPSDQMPAVYGGVWQGSAGGKGSGEAAPAIVTLSGGTAGSVVGTIAYPSLLCGGELWLLGAYADSIQLGETITYGEERCAGRGIVTLRRAADATVTFSWRNAYEPAAPAASGTLTRRSE